MRQTTLLIHAYDGTVPGITTFEHPINNVSFETVLQASLAGVPIGVDEALYLIETVMSVDYKDQVIELECEVG